MTMKVLPVERSELPIEKLIRGSQHLTQEELLSIIIGSGSKKESVFDIARRITDVDTARLKDLSPKMISEKYSLGLRTACKIKACIELSHLNSIKKRKIRKIDDPKEASEFARGFLDNRMQEELIGIFLDTKNKIIQAEKLYKGTLNYIAIHPRDVLREAVRCNCAGIILAHNHPSGDPVPSNEDIEITKRIAEASKIISIPLLDHIIIGDDYHSMKENGEI
ncbi:MAG: RadC family protein [Candidatus Woesearchaeota archaeon]